MARANAPPPRPIASSERADVNTDSYSEDAAALVEQRRSHLGSM